MKNPVQHFTLVNGKWNWKQWKLHQNTAAPRNSHNSTNIGKFWFSSSPYRTYVFRLIHKVRHWYILFCSGGFLLEALVLCHPDWKFLIFHKFHNVLTILIYLDFDTLFLPCCGVVSFEEWLSWNFCICRRNFDWKYNCSSPCSKTLTVRETQKNY